MSRDYAPLARWMGILTWLSYVLLFGQQVVDAWLTSAPAIIWVGKLLPLLIFLPGMLKDNPRSYIWLCFISLMYFIALVERTFAEPHSTLAWFGLACVIVLFSAAMLYVRWRSKALKAAEAPLSQG